MKRYVLLNFSKICVGGSFIKLVQERRLASVMVNTKSSLVRNMAAEFLKTRGDFEKTKEQDNDAKLAEIQENINCKTTTMGSYFR